MKKNILLLLVFIPFLSVLSQNKTQIEKKETPRIIQKGREFYKDSTLTSENSWLSKFLKRNLNKKDLEVLKNVSYHSKNRKDYQQNEFLNHLNDEEFNKLIQKISIKNNIETLNFAVNKHNEIDFFHFAFSRGTSAISNKITPLFKQIPLKKIGLTKKNNEGYYTLQLFEYKNNIPYINASTKAVKIDKPRFLAPKKTTPFKISESAEKYFKTKKTLFEELTQPNQESVISKFFKKRLSKSDIKYINYSAIKNQLSLFDPLALNDYSNKINLTFEVSPEGKILRPFIVTGNHNLNMKIGRILKEISIKKIGLSKPTNFKRYVIQLFDYNAETKTPFINASTFPVEETQPTLTSCKHKKSSSSRKNCTVKKIKEYCINHLSVEVITNQKIRGQIQLRPKFIIDFTGKITVANSIAPNKILKNELDRILMSFDESFIPSTLNRKPVYDYYETYFNISIDEN